MALTPGSVFAGYLIERRLGTGGMGAVYAARHPRLPRLVALKVLAEGLGSESEFRARFEREAELAARLDHPNVVTVYDRGIEGDQPWIAMQFVDGSDADKLVKQGRDVLPPVRAVNIISQAARGLDHAHRHGLLHRDIKPANILVAEEADEGDKVLVTDFGIARALDETMALTSAGSSPATVPYASPEQLEGCTLDHLSDVYSLGCTLYVMLTGSVPFPRDSRLAVMRAHLAEPPPRPTDRVPTLPPGFDDVIAKAMAKRPIDRYASCRALAAAAEAALAGQTVPSVRWGVAPVPASPQLTDPSKPSIPTVAVPAHSDPNAPTMVPFAATALRAGPPPPPKTRRPVPKRAIALVALAGAVVIGGGVTGFALLANDGETTAAGPTTAAPTTAVAAASGPWKSLDFMAKAMPTLIPESPSAKNYAGERCVAVNAQFEEISDLDTPTNVGRIRCGVFDPDSGRSAYWVTCSRDRTSVADPRDLDGVTNLKQTRWSRDGSAGEVQYGTYAAGDFGIVTVSFDSPFYCKVNAFGTRGSTGQQVYDGWFETLPL